MKILTICLAMINDEAGQSKFEELYYRYKGLMLHCANNLLQDMHLAEDAVNIAFFQIAQNIHRIGEVDSASTRRLAVTITERRAIELYRARQREYNRTTVMEAAMHMEKEYDNEQELLLTEAILKLSPTYQQVIILKYSQGYSNREIAALLDYTVSKVDQLLSRGRRQLRILLEEV